MDEVITKLANIGAILGAAMLSGGIACCSYPGTTTISIAPLDILVKQFYRLYHVGKSSAPHFAATAAVCNGISVYQARNDGLLVAGLASRAAFYIAAAISVMAIVPFTVLYMEPAVNRRLLSLGSQANKGVKGADLAVSEVEVRSLLARWTKFNFVRAGLVGLGALLAAAATVA